MQADAQKPKPLQGAATRGNESSFSYSIRQENVLGRTIRIVDTQTGNGMLRFRYDVFGKAYIAHEGTPNNYGYYNSVMLRFLYTGREMLATAGGIGAGLMDYRNRVYSITLGRFLQPDPIGFDAGDVNWYRYVGNSPIDWVDPDGEIANFAAGAIIGGTAGFFRGVISGAKSGNSFLGTIAKGAVGAAAGAIEGLGIATANPVGIGGGLMVGESLNQVGGTLIDILDGKHEATGSQSQNQRGGGKDNHDKSCTWILYSDTVKDCSRHCKYYCGDKKQRTIKVHKMQQCP